MTNGNNISLENSGFTFEKYEEEEKSPFDRLLEIFQELIVHTSGDIDETLNWMDQLNKEYNLYSDEYSKDDFIADLKKHGYIKDDEDKPKGKGFVITAKTEQVIRKRALDQIFGELKKSGKGNHKTKHTGAGQDTTGEMRNYSFGSNCTQLRCRFNVQTFRH